MSKAMQLVGIILLGIFTLVIIYLMNDVRSTNELDYYLLQEVTEASMYDAVDYSYYRGSGLLKVDRDMFLESFNRRFAESVDNNRDYEIKIIDFNETPPKVSIEVTAPTVASVKGEVAMITNRVSGIIETIYDDYVYSRGAYGTANIDQSPPTILLSDEDGDNDYTIVIQDDYLIYGYKIIQLSDSNKSSGDSLCNSITKWDDPSPGEWVQTFVTNKALSNDEEGFWIVAIDAANNCKATPLSDIAPWFKDPVIYNSSTSTLVATMYDDHGLSKYYIAPNTWSTDDVTRRCDSNSNICKAINIEGKKATDSSGNTIYQASIDIKLNEKGLDVPGTYRLFVVDNNNKITKSNTDLWLREVHKPSIAWEYNSTSNTGGDLKLTFTDDGNDLKDAAGYVYNTTNIAPVNDTDYSKNWSGSDSSKTVTIPVSEGKIYIWVRDSQRDGNNMALALDIENATNTPQCASGGTLNSDKTKCSYTSNEAQCGKEGYNWDSCLTFNNKNGDCTSWSESVCTCEVMKTCTFETYQCGPAVETYIAETQGNAIQGFKVTCGVNGFPVHLVRTDTKKDSRCGYNSASGSVCNGSGVRNKVCTDPVCQSYEQVKDESTCQGGYRNWRAKSCTKDPNYSYTCPEGYNTGSNNTCYKLDKIN